MWKDSLGLFLSSTRKGIKIHPCFMNHGSIQDPGLGPPVGYELLRNIPRCPKTVVVKLSCDPGTVRDDPIGGSAHKRRVPTRGTFPPIGTFVGVVWREDPPLGTLSTGSERPPAEEEVLL